MRGSVLRFRCFPHSQLWCLRLCRSLILPVRSGVQVIFLHRQKLFVSRRELNVLQSESGRLSGLPEKAMFRWHRQSVSVQKKRLSVLEEAGLCSADGFLTAEAVMAVLAVAVMTVLCASAVHMRFSADCGMDRAGAEMDARFEAALLEQEGCDTTCRETESSETPDPFS